MLQSASQIFAGDERKLEEAFYRGGIWRIVHLYHNSSWRHDGDENRLKSFDKLYNSQNQMNKEPASAAADLSRFMLGAVSECCIREGNLAFVDWLEMRLMVIYTTQYCNK